jgi:hypothetical protein
VLEHLRNLFTELFAAKGRKKRKTFDTNFTNYREFKCAEDAKETSPGLEQFLARAGRFVIFNHGWTRMNTDF